MNKELWVVAVSDVSVSLLCTEEDAKDVTSRTSCWLWDGVRQELSDVKKPAAVWTKFVIMDEAIIPPVKTSAVLGYAVFAPEGEV